MDMVKHLIEDYCMPPQDNKQIILDNLKRGTEFKNIYGMTFVPIAVDKSKNSITVDCYTSSGTYSHPEVWDDLDVTINTFLIDEYKFINKK